MTRPSSGHLTESAEIAKFVFIWGLRVSLEVIGELTFIVWKEQPEVRVFSKKLKKKTTNLIQSEVEYAMPNSMAVETCME